MSSGDRILVVEDEGIVAMEIGDRLSHAGFRVIGPVSTGEAAVESALAERPDLVLMDVRLKGDMDGVAAAERIQRQIDLPFVFLTAHADDATLARVKPIEPHAYVIKPFEARALTVTIQLVLHRHRAAKARAEAERAQKRSDARLRAVLDNSHDGILCVDGDRRITVYNRGAERIFGYSAEEMIGQPLEALIPAELGASHRAEFERFRVTGRTSRPMGASREVVGLRRSGEKFPAEVTISRFEVEGEPLLTACVRDVSERRALEDQSIRAQKMEAVGRLAASLAHDFNNLLAAVQSNVYLMKCEAPEPLQEHIAEIGDIVDRGVALTRQLLGFSRQQQASPQRIDANELVAGAEALLRRLVRKDVVLRTVLDERAGSVNADRNLLEQVLMNLVVNGRDAMPQGGQILIRTGTELREGGDGGEGPRVGPGSYVRIEVSDEGPGVPEELHEKVFDAFFTTKAPGLGTGLGLSTVRSIVRRSGGDVYIRKGAGPGATFVVLLPRADGGHRPPRARRDEEAASRGTETILLVEDEPAILRATAEILERSGYVVHAARTAEEALARAAAKAEGIDLLLSDLVMPGCSGRELARRIVALRPGLPVLLMTGYSEEAAHPREGDGAERVLEKPVHPVVLLRAVRDRLDRAGRRLRDQEESRDA
jgi:PAS domain S-box-containing protein